MKYGVSGNPSADSCICSSSPIQSPCLETLLDCPLVLRDLYHASKPQTDDWHGLTKTRNMVCQ